MVLGRTLGILTKVVIPSEARDLSLSFRLFPFISLFKSVRSTIPTPGANPTGSVISPLV
jgi:hypothetical protein